MNLMSVKLLIDLINRPRYHASSISNAQVAYTILRSSNILPLQPCYPNENASIFQGTVLVHDEILDSRNVVPTTCQSKLTIGYSE